MLRCAVLGVVTAVLLTGPAVPAAGDTSGGAWSNGFGDLGVWGRQGAEGRGGRGPSRTAEQREAARQRYLAHLAQLRLEHETRLRIFPECNPAVGRVEEWCAWQPPEAGATTAPSRQAVEAYVRTVTASMQLPEAYPQVGPDPTWNEWNMAVIGIPLWLWVEGPAQMSASRSEAGLAVSLDARHVSTTFTMGDGRTVTCASTKPYVRDAVKAGDPSPVCGHTYQVAAKSPSPAGATTKTTGTYSVTATTHWSVDWTAGGYSGTLTTQMSGSRDLPVGELQAVVIRS